MDITEKARIFATAAHGAVGQVRKYTNEPYIVHPAEVVRILSEYITDSEIIAAAWLHDVVEDTDITLDDIGSEFGDNVRSYVYFLTDTKSSGMNRDERKAADRARLKNAPADVQSIKVADMLSNLQSIIENDPKFAKVFIEEKILLLEVLRQANNVLAMRAWNAIRQGEKLLGLR